MKHIDKYASMTSYSYGPFKFNDNTTLAQLKQFYEQYKLHPTARYALLNEYDNFCLYAKQ